MKRRPFLFIGLASFLAAVLCTFAPVTATIGIAATVALVLIGIGVRAIPLPFARTAMIGVAAVAVALSFTAHIVYTVKPQTALDGSVVTATVRVEEALHSAKAYIVRTESGDLAKGMRLCFWPNTDGLAPRNGDLLTAEMTLVAAYDPVTEQGFTAKANGVYLYAWPTKDSTVIWDDGQASLSWWQTGLYAMRDGIREALYRHADFDTAATAQGIMLGQRDNLSASIRAAFRASGVYHLLAVSGTHLAILTSLMLYLLRQSRCSRRVTALLTMVFVAVFMALCGFTASVTRAGVMTLILLSGQLFHRRTDGLNTIGFAVTVMLLCDPFCLYDIGWQLSFAATLGLLLIQPVWEREITARIAPSALRCAGILAPLSTAVGVTVSATLATAPLCAWHFGGVSTMFLFSNLLCVPLASVLLVVMFAAVLTVWIPFVRDVLFAVGTQLCRLLWGYTERLSSLSVAQMTTDGFVTVWLFALTAALVFGYVRARMRGVLRVMVVMTAVLLLGTGIVGAVMRNVSHLAAASGNSLVITVKSENTNGLILGAGADAIEEGIMLLADEGIRSLDWLLWLGTAEEPLPDLSVLSVPIERLLTVSPPEEYRALPTTNSTVELQDGAGLMAGEQTFVERCADFVRLRIADTTVCLTPLSGKADAACLPSDWCCAEWLCTDTIFENRDAVEAANTIVFCSFGRKQTMVQAFPTATVAVEQPTQHLRMNIANRKIV